MFFRCRRCLYPNLKPDLWFSSDGLCSACIAFDKRKEIDWTAKEHEFLELVRSNPGKTHDCIVAVSGGKDSHWQVLKCLELGFRPLAVCATTDHLSHIGRQNLDNIAELCDLIEVTPHKPTRRKISKFSLEEVGDISWCEHHLIWSVPAREAVARSIPIVLYGECPQNEYGAGPAGTETRTQLTKPWVDEFGGLLGLRLSDVAEILQIDDRFLELYRYPEDKVQALWMGAYFDWDGWRNAQVAARHGFRTYDAGVERSFGGYENLDNLQTGVHDYMRWLKFGYSRATDILSNHIRRGYASREAAAQMDLDAALQLPATYLGIRTSDILANIGVSMSAWREICERFTNKPVVEWASKPASYQCYYSTSAAVSRVGSSITIAA